MSFAAVLDRLDDWINPIVVKELRQAVKSRIVVVILMAFLAVQLFVMGSFLMVRSAQADHGQADWDGGLHVFWALQVVLSVTVVLILPSYASVRFGAERTDNNVDLLFITTLTPRAIVLGKFWASVALSLLVVSMVAPFMVFAYLMRGIDLPTMLVVLGIDLLATMAATMYGLLLASIPGGRPLKAFLSLIGFIQLIYATVGVAALTFALTYEAGGLLTVDAGLFWTIAAGIAVLSLALTALLFSYAVALISPPSSNRVLPIRLCVLGFWLVTGAAMLAWVSLIPPMLFLQRSLPVFLWIIFNIPVLCLQFTISICERDAWGQRVARAIPRNPLLRFFAFMLYTGSAGGILFTLILMAATLGVGYIALNALGTDERLMQGLIAGQAGACLYCACYGLSAYLLRAHVLRGRVQRAHTWILVLLLVGLGCAVPAILAFSLFSDNLRSGTDSGWWLLPNPLWTPVALSEGSWEFGRRHDFAMMAWAFLGVWLVLALALASPSLGAQIGRFRPFRPRAAEAR